MKAYFKSLNFLSVIEVEIEKKLGDNQYLCVSKYGYLILEENDRLTKEQVGQLQEYKQMVIEVSELQKNIKAIENELGIK